MRQHSGEVFHPADGSPHLPPRPFGADGPPALHTGDEVQGWDGYAGGAMGRDCVACGNTLAGEQVPRAMVDTFAATSGEQSSHG